LLIKKCVNFSQLLKQKIYLSYNRIEFLYKQGEVMSWFDNNEKVYPTKMFVNYLPEVSDTKSDNESHTKSIGGALASAALGVQGVAVEMILTAAPKLIDQGMKLVADTLTSLASDKAYPTNVSRNFDTINPAKLSLPSKITLVRGNFAPNNNVIGETFGDGEKRDRNQSVLLDSKELHIEIDIVQSEDKSAIYFQANSYFYSGESPDGSTTDEIVLAFAFLPASQNIVDPKKDFTNFLNFKGLAPNTQYTFKSESGYDSSFQSPWITTPLDDVEPYTMLIQIQEIREGYAFAKLIQTIYLENESYIKEGVNNKVHNLKESKNEK